jgi:RNA polymerase sigma factor (sigma-70 family)
MFRQDDDELRRLIIAARHNGNSDAFGLLFHRFAEDLSRRFDRRLARFPGLRKKHSVDDMVQETAVSAVRGFRTFQGENPELFHAVRHVRKKKRDIGLEYSRWLAHAHGDGDVQTSPLNLEDTTNALGARREGAPTQQAARSERREILLEVLDELSPHYRQVITLRSLQCLSVDETAAIMRIDRRYVEVMRLRAIKKLGELLMARGFSTASF